MSLTNWIWRRRLANFRKRHLDQPVPLQACMELQRRAATALGDPYALIPPAKERITDASALADAELARKLNHITFGDFAPPAATLNWLARFIERYRPTRVLEFGSGISTYCMAFLLEKLHGPDGFRLLSFDQESAFVEKTRNLLESLPSKNSCRVVHAALRPDSMDGRAIRSYDLSASQEHLAWIRPAEFVFVDGPFGEGPCRYRTVPAVLPFLSSTARFVMDDSYREKELNTAEQWHRDGFHIDGVITVGEGLLLGHI